MIPSPLEWIRNLSPQGLVRCWHGHLVPGLVASPQWCLKTERMQVVSGSSLLCADKGACTPARPQPLGLAGNRKQTCVFLLN